MAIEFQSGIRTTPLQHEMSPLDAAIERYAQKAKEFYDSESKLSNTLTEEERKTKLKAALKKLEEEKRLAEVAVSVQSQLEKYREFGEQNKTAGGIDVLSAEKHHPTKILAQFMRAAGKPRPSSKHTAHHIAPGKGKTPNAGLARLHMHTFGIRINDPDNGAWLVRLKKDTPHWSMPNAKSHLTIHTHNYESWVFQQISTQMSSRQIRQRLNLLGRMLQDGNQPKSVTLPPLES